MTGRGYGLIIEKTQIQKNWGKSKFHTMAKCNTKTYFIATCSSKGMALCRVCGKPR